MPPIPCLIEVCEGLLFRIIEVTGITQTRQSWDAFQTVLMDKSRMIKINHSASKLNEEYQENLQSKTGYETLNSLDLYDPVVRPDIGCI